MPDHHNALPAGYRLGEYEIQTVLGSGGFGVTYKAHDHNLDKQVAIKEYLPPEFAVRDGRTTVKPKSSASKDDYAWGLDRFLDEARALARFDHPHINKVHRFFKENGTAYLVLEYVEGDLLSDLLRVKGRFNEAGIRRMLDELLDGLDAVHKAGYIHRDIKPANIMFRRDGSAVLLDFGAARQAIGQRSQMITSILTPGYAPVEQYLTSVDEMGAWSDLYSLGVVAYRCLVGGDESVLIDAPSRAHLLREGETGKDMPPAVKIGKGEYSDSLLAAIDWAMRVEKSDRPQSVGAMQAALAGDSEVIATSPAIKTAKKAKKKTSATRTVKVTKAQKAQPPWALLGFVTALALLLFVTVALGVSHYQQRQAEKIAAAAKAERAEFFRAVGRDASAWQVDSDGTTDLHTATLNGWGKLAKWLVNNGANVNAKTETGWTPLHYAAAMVYLRYADKTRPRATDEDAVDAAKLLIANGADVNAKADSGMTPLFIAALWNAVGVAKLLLANGADVNMPNNSGDAPLDMAGTSAMQSLLKQHGGRCNSSWNIGSRDANNPYQFNRYNPPHPPPLIPQHQCPTTTTPSPPAIDWANTKSKPCSAAAVSASLIKRTTTTWTSKLR